MASNCYYIGADTTMWVHHHHFIKKLKNKKSPGPDGVANELLKSAASLVRKPLAHLMNACLQNETIPSDWRNALVILIFKKGDPTDLKNYRPISLLSHMYKLFTKILTERISTAIDLAQSKDQAGFRSNRSAIDHLQALNQLSEKSVEFQIPISLAFIDFEKAFDSVEIPAVLNALREQNIHPKYIRTLQNIYSCSTSTIRLHVEGDSFPINRGVRQGDTISP